MTVTTTNLIQGPGTLWSGAFGATEPADATTAPGIGWTDAGGTKDGVSLEINQTYTELAVDQIVDVPERRLTKREMTLSTNLAEATLDNLALAMNVAAPTAGTNTLSLEPTDDTAATQPTYSALLFDGYAPNSKARRVIIRKALQTNAVSFAYKKDDQTVFSVAFSCHYVSPSIKPFSITDDTTTV